MHLKIKICCISSLEEAKTAIELGASAIGLVGRMPSGPGIIDDKLIKQIALSVPSLVDTFLLTSETTAECIINHHNSTNTSTIQIVDKPLDGTYQQLREALPGVKFVQVIHVIDEESVEQAIQIAEQVDAILLDSGNPKLPIKELGGTGRVHNWKLSRKIVDAITTPVFLAGGLNPKNVQQAIQEVQPYGIDLCSGVRTSGKLDRNKLELFMSRINNT